MKVNGANRDQVGVVLGQRVREERRRLGLTQEQLAERAGLSTNYIAHLERGSRGASLSTIESMCAIFDVPFASMFVAAAPGARAAAEDPKKLAARLKGMEPRARQLVYQVAETVARWRPARKGRGRR